MTGKTKLAELLGQLENLRVRLAEELSVSEIVRLDELEDDERKPALPPTLGTQMDWLERLARADLPALNEALKNPAIDDRVLTAVVQRLALQNQNQARELHRLRDANETIKKLQAIANQALTQYVDAAARLVDAGSRRIDEQVAILTEAAEPKAGRTFAWAMRELRCGRPVRRAHWQAEPESPAELYASVSSTGHACIRFRRKDGTSGSTDDFLYPLNSFLAARFFGDVFADDWQSA